MISKADAYKLLAAAIEECREYGSIYDAQEDILYNAVGRIIEGLSR